MQISSAFRLIVVALLVVAVVAVLSLPPVKAFVSEALQTFLESVQGLGPWGPVALAGAYVVATVFMVPGSLLTLGAGFAFGVIQGFLAVWVGSNLGATAAFLVGRQLARGWVERKVAGNPKFQAVDRAIGEQGFKIVLLVRLSPVFPFVFLNYALSLTRIPLGQFMLASLIGMLPGTLMYVYLGSVVQNLAELGAGREKGTLEQVLFYAGLLATIVVTVLITRIARQALKTAVPVQNDNP